MERFSALIGFVLILAIAFALSNNRRAIRWRTVFWGISLQVVVAVTVLKGVWIAGAFAAIAPRISSAVAAAIFVVLAVVVYFIGRQMPAAASRRPLWWGFGAITAYLFLAYNLLAFIFERLKDEIREGRSPRSAVPRAWIRAASTWYRMRSIPATPRNARHRTGSQRGRSCRRSSSAWRR